MASREEITAALEAARAAGQTSDVLTLERALRDMPLPEGPAPVLGQAVAATPARAVTRGLEQLASFGFAPEIRAQIYAATRHTPEEKTAMEARREALARSKTETGAAGLVDPMRESTAYQEEHAREINLLRRLSQEHPFLYYGTQVAPMVHSLAKAGWRTGADALRRRSQKLAMISTKTPGKWFDKDMIESPRDIDRPYEVAEELVKRRGQIPLKNPGVQWPEFQRIQDRVGQQIGKVADEASKRGAQVDLGRITARFNTEVAPQMAKEPQTAEFANAIREYLSTEVLSRRGRAMSASEAWDWRQSLDDALYGLSGKIDPTLKMPQQGRLALRRIVSEELGNSIGAKGFSSEWSRLNPEYSRLSDLNRVLEESYRAKGRESIGPMFVSPFAVRPGGGGFYARFNPFRDRPYFPKQRMDIIDWQIRQGQKPTQLMTPTQVLTGLMRDLSEEE